MRKMSIRNLFKKSDSGRYRILVIILIIVVLAGIIYLGYPLVFPDSSVKLPATPAKKVITPSSTVVATKIETKPEVKEKTEFEIEMEKRKQSYEDKIFVYKPYEPPSNRNPFQKVRTSYYLGETAKKEEEDILRFPKPELPPGTKLSGIIDSANKRVAIIKMDEETYIANLYDIISERYIVKEIKKDEVIIDFNGYFFSLKIGGEEASNE
jgi:hypothetical protein